LDAFTTLLAADLPPDHAKLPIDATGTGATFELAPFSDDVEITGPMCATLFVTVRLLDPTGADITFRSALDPDSSTPHRPLHVHDEPRPLRPGEVVEVEVEILPTSIVVPASHRLAITISGRDFEFSGDGHWSQLYGIPMRGQAIFLHNDPVDRPDDLFGGVMALYSGPA